MDCEHFDRVVLDWLYQELDEIEVSATQRHLAHCTRCRNIASHLRASREVGLVPNAEAPESLPARILEAERSVHAALPLRKRLGRAVSVLAGWTMRPQLAMGALLLLMIGASLVFLRAGPGDRDPASVTERGVPEMPGPSRSASSAHAPSDEASLSDEADSEVEAAVPAPIPSASTAPAAPSSEAPALDISEASARERFDAAVAQFHQQAFGEALTEFELLAATATSVAPHAQLFSARATRHQSGCAAAIPLFEALHKKLNDEALSLEALWLAAECERQLKRWEKARSKYEVLRPTPRYGARADQALRALKRASTAADAGAAPATPQPLHSVAR